MKIQRSVIVGCIAVLTMFVVGTGRAAAQSEGTSTCAAQAAWATSPSLPDFRKEPIGFCAFYQYSWQSFLYLTKPGPAQGVLLFETFPAISELFPAHPVSVSSCSTPDQKTGRRGIFLPRRAKPEGASINQAGSDGILVDQAGNVTYYEQYFNPRFASFVQQCRFDYLSCQMAPEAASLRTPEGSIAIKSSWRPISDKDPNYSRFHTIKNITVEDPQTGGCRTTDLALVGLHLVYAPANHPEMIWATFEHIANAPDGRCTGNPTTPPTGFESWTYNDRKSTDCFKANIWPAMPPPYPHTQAFRNWSNGNDPGNSLGKLNIDLVQGLNKSVAGVLPDSSVWKNYYLIGAVWTSHGQLPAVQPSQSTNGNLIGAPYLANVTMETFTQTPNPLGPNVQTKSCLFCHNVGTQTPRSFQVSHAFANSDQTAACPWLPPAGTGKLPAACLETQDTPKTAGTTAAPALIPSH